MNDYRILADAMEKRYGKAWKKGFVWLKILRTAIKQQQNRHRVEKAMKKERGL
jgi:hypothetical protein